MKTKTKKGFPNKQQKKNLIRNVFPAESFKRIEMRNLWEINQKQTFFFFFFRHQEAVETVPGK